MGLIQAVGATLTTVLADQWREYFYCDSLPENVLMRRGVKRTNGKSSNTRGSDNIISNGSIIAVNDGQCMMIVDQGGIVEFTAQPGEFVWDKSTEPSIFYGSLGENLKKTWEVLKKRFTFGGDTAKDQRVYYFNIKEIVGNKYGTANPVGFRVYYPNINLDTEIGIRCFGEYSYKLTDPMLFYKNVAANVSGDYTRDRIDSQLKSEFLTALQPAFAKISDMGIRYSALPGHTMELADSMNTVLSPKWAELRGISIVSVGVSSVNA
ncbi:MAG: SPFH domain-containing protein, partial [Clostridia bacterium]|nr:SPFH domain-containing protein [Clostridia bacterium]